MVDRVGDWNKFAKDMEKYIGEKTVSKYGVDKSGIDLMEVTEPRICLWNILKYAFRLWNNKGKKYDMEKIAHYAQLAITLSKGDKTQYGVREISDD